MLVFIILFSIWVTPGGVHGLFLAVGSDLISGCVQGFIYAVPGIRPGVRDRHLQRINPCTSQAQTFLKLELILLG